MECAFKAVWPDNWKKIRQIFGKKYPKELWSKNAKISTPKLNLKAKNIYVKTLLNLENLKNTFLSVNVKKLF